jgi:hypothetical protein
MTILSNKAIVCWVFALAPIVGCTRAGFYWMGDAEPAVDNLPLGISDGRLEHGNPQDLFSPRDAFWKRDASIKDATSVTIGAESDTCEGAADVDLSSGLATITLSTQGAKNDYGFLQCCGGNQSDIIIRLVNPGASVGLACTEGSGSLMARYQPASPPETCPSTTSGNTCNGDACGSTNNLLTITPAATGTMVALCRDPSLPPVRVVLQNQ